MIYNTALLSIDNHLLLRGFLNFCWICFCRRTMGLSERDCVICCYQSVLSDPEIENIQIREMMSLLIIRNVEKKKKEERLVMFKMLE